MLMQLGLAGLIMLAGQSLPQIGADGLVSMKNRLLTIGMTVLYGMAVLVIPRSAGRMAAA